VKGFKGGQMSVVDVCCKQSATVTCWGEGSDQSVHLGQLCFILMESKTCGLLN